MVLLWDGVGALERIPLENKAPSQNIWSCSPVSNRGRKDSLVADRGVGDERERRKGKQRDDEGEKVIRNVREGARDKQMRERRGG